MTKNKTMNCKNYSDSGSIVMPELYEVDAYSAKKNNSKKILIDRKRAVRYTGSTKMPVAGYGRCRACDCKGYISKHNGSHECKTCNHHYDRHN